MKSLASLAFLILISLQPLCAQRGLRGSRQQNQSQNSSSQTLYVSGKVVLGDGSEPTERVLIQSTCRGQNRTEAHTDAHGNFSFRFGDRISSMVESRVDNDSAPASRAPVTAQDCELSASLAGYSSDRISLDGRMNGSENVDIGRIVLHRLTNIEGLTISATTAAAPGPARKAFSKGQEQELNGQLEEAKKSLEKAVRLYPKFAAAWFELGTVQIQLKEVAAARDSFEHSIAADEKYISPYPPLMRLAIGDQNWHRVIEVSDRLLGLNPVNFPDAWYFNGVGHFYLEEFLAAEKSARRGLAIDLGHRMPKLEYLLGMALMKINAYGEAALHMQAYLQMVKNPADISEAQKQLAEIARLSGNPGQATQNR